MILFPQCEYTRTLNARWGSLSLIAGVPVPKITPMFFSSLITDLSLLTQTATMQPPQTISF